MFELASVRHARELHEKYIATRNTYHAARQDYITAMRSGDERLLEYASHVANVAFRASEQAFRQYLGERTYTPVEA